MNIEGILDDFIEVCRFSNILNFKKNSIEIKEEHPTKGLEKNTMAVYIFMHGDRCLKVGKAGPNSNARYIYRHYNYKFGNSNYQNHYSMIWELVLRRI